MKLGNLMAMILIAQGAQASQDIVKIPIQSSLFKSLSDATKDYWQRCDSELKRFKSPSIKNNVLSTYCEGPYERNHPSKYGFYGTAFAVLLKPALVTITSLQSIGTSEIESKSLMATECNNWISKNLAPGAQTLLEDCGSVSVEYLGKSGTGASLWQSQSTAIRINAIKTAFAVYPSCYCRGSYDFKDYTDTWTGKPKRSYFEIYELMYLDNAGSYQKISRWNTSVDCEDAITALPVCKEK